MAHLNDCKLTVFERFFADGGHIQDMEIKWVHAQHSATPKAPQFNEAWSQYWDTLSIADGGYNDRAYAFLKAQSAVGETLSDLWYDFWCRVQGGGTAITALVKDTFTDADDTAINAHTPEVGGPWVLATVDGTAPVAGKVVVSGNQLAFKAGGEGAVIDTSETDTVIGVDYTPGAGSRDGVIGRLASNGNLVAMRIRVPESVIELVHFTGGAVTSAASVAFTYEAGKTYRLTLRISGNVYTGYIDGVEVVSATITQHATGTSQGLTSFGTDYVERFDNLIVAQ